MTEEMVKALTFENSRLERLQRIVDELEFNRLDQLNAITEGECFDPEIIRSLKVIEILVEAGAI